MGFRALSLLQNSLVAQVWIFWALFSTIFAQQSVFRFDFLGKLITFVFRAIVILTLLKIVYLNAHKDILDFHRVMWPILMTQVLLAGRTRIFDEIRDDIIQGTISMRLILPIHYIFFRYVDMLAKSLPNVCIMALFGWIFGYWMAGLPQGGWMGTVYSVVLIIGALTVQFLGYTAMALFAFFWEDTESLRFLYSKGEMVLGGNIVPISILPPFIGMIAFFSPFASSGYTAWLVLVSGSGQDFLWYGGLELLWIGIYSFVVLGIFRYGCKKLIVNGG